MCTTSVTSLFTVKWVVRSARNDYTHRIKFAGIFSATSSASNMLGNTVSYAPAISRKTTDAMLFRRLAIRILLISWADACSQLRAGRNPNCPSDIVSSSVGSAISGSRYETKQPAINFSIILDSVTSMVIGR